MSVTEKLRDEIKYLVGKWLKLDKDKTKEVLIELDSFIRKIDEILKRK